MKPTLIGLLRLQPFDQSSDPPKPAWIDSWWFGGMLLVGALSCAFGALSLLDVEGGFTFALFATAATLFLLAGVLEWFAHLKARSLNTFFVAGLCIVAIVASSAKVH